MMLPLQELLKKYQVEPRGVIHVGAHWAQEHDEYRKCGIERFVYIEPCKEAFVVLCEKFKSDKGSVEIANKIMRAYAGDVVLINAACGEEPGEAVMYVSHQNQGQSNSLLEPGLHIEQHPEVVFDDGEIVKVQKLDNLVGANSRYDFLVMDAQGAEGLVLKGGRQTMENIKAVYTEVNRGQTYKGNMEIEDMDAFLADYGLIRVETYWPSPNWTWGDALYVKNTGQLITTEAGLNNYTQSYNQNNK